MKKILLFTVMVLLSVSLNFSIAHSTRFVMWEAGTRPLYGPVEEGLEGIRGEIVEDSTASGGKAVRHGSEHDFNHIVWGPYETLPPGKYRVYFILKVDSLPVDTGKEAFYLDVVTDAGATTLASKSIKYVSFQKKVNEWVTFYLDFTLNTETSDLEYRVMPGSGFEGNLYVDTIIRTDMFEIPIKLNQPLNISFNVFGIGGDQDTFHIQVMFCDETNDCVRVNYEVDGGIISENGCDKQVNGCGCSGPTQIKTASVNTFTCWVNSSYWGVTDEKISVSDIVIWYTIVNKTPVERLHPNVKFSYPCPPRSCQELLEGIYCYLTGGCESAPDVNSDGVVNYTDAEEVMNHCGDDAWCSQQLQQPSLSLTIIPSIDVIGLAPNPIRIVILNETSHVIFNKTTNEEWTISDLSPGYYLIWVSSKDASGREFSHFYDKGCSEENTTYRLDTDSNPYRFYLGRRKEIEIYYKAKVNVNVSYDGLEITGHLLDEYGNSLKPQGHVYPTCGPKQEVIQLNRNVTLYYKKDGLWYPIASVETDENGDFSYSWKCKPGTEAIKAVYEPTSWYYMPAEKEIPVKCDLNTEVRVCDRATCDSSPFYHVSCKGSFCELLDGLCSGSCPTFECEDKITLELYLSKGEGSIDLKDLDITVSYLVVNETDGSISKIESFEKHLNSLEALYPPKRVNFSVPASYFANMPEGQHLGFKINVKVNGVDFVNVDDFSDAPPPRIDNSRIYSVSCCPHVELTCEGEAKIGEAINCTAVYTHDQGEAGRVHFHWLYGFADIPEDWEIPKGCVKLCYDSEGRSSTDCAANLYRVLECDVSNGDSISFQLVMKSTGSLDIYYRAFDWSKDENCGGWCEYSKDPLFGECTGACEEIDGNTPNNIPNIISCDSKVISFNITGSPDLVITDVFSYDGLVGYEITNMGNAGAFPSKTSLEINGNKVTEHTAGFLLPRDRIQYAFTGVNWRDYCPNNPTVDDVVSVNVCADYLDEIDEDDKGNNCMQKDFPCCTPTSETEICNDLIDNDCDGKVDCNDTDCIGATGPNGGICCQADTDCSAIDTDGLDEFTFGSCTPAVCDYSIHECKMLEEERVYDTCNDNWSVKERRTDSNACVDEIINCPENYVCDGGVCKPGLTCTGEIELTLIPNRAYPGYPITVYTSGLEYCDGKTIYLRKDSCTGSLVGSCTVGEDGNGCIVQFDAPTTEEEYTYYACIDKNGNGDFAGAGEQDSAVLNVTKEVYILNITGHKCYDGEGNEVTCPENNTYVGFSFFRWRAKAKDNSTVDEPIVTFYLYYDPEGNCDVTMTCAVPPIVRVPRHGVNESAFNVTIKQRKIGIPCRVIVKLFDRFGFLSAFAEYKVCNPEDYFNETHNFCGDGVDNDCDGKIDCEDEDCWGKMGNGTYCCNNDEHCSPLNSCYDYCPGCELGGGYVEQNVSTCNVETHTCSVETNVFYDDWNGDVDTPTVTYYECSGNDVVSEQTTKYDSCDVTTGAVNWYWDASEHKLKNITTDTFPVECYGKMDGTYAGVREPVCNASDGSVPDTIIENLTDCMEAGKCYCDPSINACVACGADEYCDNYQCIPSIQRCDELCGSIPPGRTDYIFYSACRNKGTGMPWEVNTTSNCTVDGSKECYCYMKCEPYDSYQCPKTWAYCHFGATYPGGRMSHYFPLRNVTYKEDFKIREAVDLHNLFVNLTYDPSQGDYDLYVKWSDVCPNKDDPSTYDCGPGNYYEDVPGKKVCYKDSLPSGTTARVTVYNSTSSQGKYNISVNSDEIKYEIKEGTMKIEHITPPPETTTFPILQTTTTTISTWQQVQLGILEFIKKLFGLSI